jgi:hypothetical protein
MMRIQLFSYERGFLSKEQNKKQGKYLLGFFFEMILSRNWDKQHFHLVDFTSKTIQIHRKNTSHETALLNVRPT